MKERRKELDINQEELAQKVGVARQTVSSWERGEFPPKQDKLMNIASALDTKVGYLLGETDDPNPSVSSPARAATSPKATAITADSDKSTVRKFSGRPPSPEKILSGRGLMEWLRAHGKRVSDDTIELPVLSPELTACCGRGISILDCTSEPDETIVFERKDVGIIDDLNPPYVVNSDGESMEGYKIHRGAKCVVNPVEEVSNGDIAFVKFGDDAMIKKVYWRRDGGAELKSSDGETITVSNEDFECGWAQILGRIMASVVKL